MQKQFEQVSRLLWVMEQLRDPDTGCPWDLQQTFKTIVPYTIEEAYEVADAIEHGDMADVKDELGDLLFQVVFYAQLGKEQNEFDFEAIAEAVSEKLIRRHPHIFGDSKVSSADDVKQNWDLIKQQERQQTGKDSDDSALANIPRGMGPLIRAHKIQKRCAKVGFDWNNIDPVVDKIGEEVNEVLQEAGRDNVDKEALTMEVGDLFFSVVNLARHLDVDSEAALRAANNKFEKRFRKIEDGLKDVGKKTTDLTLEALEELWQQAKKN